jgi:hypothetical protein
VVPVVNLAVPDGVVDLAVAVVVAVDVAVAVTD